MSDGSKSSTHYLSDTNRFDVSSKGHSSGPDVVIRYLHWPRIEIYAHVTELGLKNLPYLSTSISFVAVFS